MTRWRVEQGDCLDRLRALPDASVDSVVTDPPYGLAFMGKRWDYDVPSGEVWAECLRLLKPGGHLLAFAGTRTQHRMAVRIEDAGFDIRDMIAWVYGSGFPKSLDVSKAIDKAAGVEREVVGQKQVTNAAQGKGMGHGALVGGKVRAGLIDVTAPATDAARQWQGWGTALKPALEPITVARKPLAGTVAENVLAHGTGGINVDGCRIGDDVTVTVRNGNSGAHGRYGKDDRIFTRENPPGRWPANLIHDGSTEATDLLGDAARFFYTAKTSKAERDEGCEGPIALRVMHAYGDFAGTTEHGPKQNVMARNFHPTVKPIDLMRYLCRLVTPPDGLVLDPFTGSGSTGCAALLEGFRFHGIEREPDYVAIATARIAHWARQADAVQVAMPL